MKADRAETTARQKLRQLEAYRTARHATADLSPAQLTGMFDRNLRTMLDLTRPDEKGTVDNQTLKTESMPFRIFRENQSVMVTRESPTRTTMDEGNDRGISWTGI